MGHPEEVDLMEEAELLPRRERLEIEREMVPQMSFFLCVLMNPRSGVLPLFSLTILTLLSSENPGHYGTT